MKKIVKEKVILYKKYFNDPLKAAKARDIFIIENNLITRKRLLNFPEDHK